MSFDSNMRYLRCDAVFLAKVYIVSRDSELWAQGVRVGDLIHCKKLDVVAGGLYSRASVILKQEDGTIKTIIITDDTDTLVEWFVYERSIKTLI
ncbi:hypothetical protein HWV00_21150 (plasmid) [Moritella sp. 24]|uniref:hypothetical protein n=1 Tax=Moritella sp. 24 TaxID=2746230 RepID=UPI001BA64B32|nr:hypothetical protein [Moritella sp. 24]QUM78783.1 hypothetical protein HWV00_21150 [Moritella sp. 24]